MKKNKLIIHGCNTTLVQYEENGMLYAKFIKENNNCYNEK